MPVESAAPPVRRIVLGIESSCDETAVALVADDRTIVAQSIASQDAQHAPYGGVVPEIAARAHVEVLAPMVERVLDEGGMELGDVDAIAATAGPGLIGGVMVGLVTAKALAMAGAKAAAGGQPSRRARAQPAAGRRRARISLSAAARHRAGIARYWRCAVSAHIAAWPRPSTMRWARPSTRPPRSWASAIRAVRRWNALHAVAIPARLPLPRPLQGIGGTAFLLRGAEKRGPAGA